MCCREEAMANANTGWEKINDIATVSDEAFVLLILQNIWQDMMKLDIDDYYWPKK